MIRCVVLSLTLVGSRTASASSLLSLAALSDLLPLAPSSESWVKKQGRKATRKVTMLKETKSVSVCVWGGGGLMIYVKRGQKLHKWIGKSLYFT